MFVAHKINSLPPLLKGAVSVSPGHKIDTITDGI